MPSCQIHSSAEPVDYSTAVRWQEILADKRRRGVIPDTLLLLEHPPTITLGRRSDSADLLTSRAELEARGITVTESDRGGEITYHGPGQLVGYPILDLRNHGQDLHHYLRMLEEVIIQALRSFQMIGDRKTGLTGVWVNDRKIAAIGIKVSRWISMHGFSLNINPDLFSPRHDFIPCGIKDYGITSLAEEDLLRHWRRDEVEQAVVAAFSEVFGVSVFTAVEGILTP